MSFLTFRFYFCQADCFSFAMFLYELLTLKLPFEGQEQIKEYILDGGRPVLTTKVNIFIISAFSKRYH